jgi:hypothetical protein
MLKPETKINFSSFFIKSKFFSMKDRIEEEHVSKKERIKFQVISGRIGTKRIGNRKLFPELKYNNHVNLTR